MQARWLSNAHMKQTQVTGETMSENYGRRCANAMNAKDIPLYHHLKQQFNMTKASAAYEMQSQFDKAYRENRVI